MKIFKTSTKGLFTLSLSEGKFTVGFDFDSIRFICNNATLQRGSGIEAVIECDSDIAALELYNAALAFSIPCSLKHCTFITPATDGTPADEIGEQAA